MARFWLVSLARPSHSQERVWYFTVQLIVLADSGCSVYTPVFHIEGGGGGGVYPPKGQISHPKNPQNKKFVDSGGISQRTPPPPPPACTCHKTTNMFAESAPHAFVGSEHCKVPDPILFPEKGCDP